MAEQSLKSKTVRGLGWSAADIILNQGITFVVGIVLARLLSPSEYGLIGLITIFITIFNAIIDSGFSNAIIRKKDATNDDYNTMFIVNIVASIFLFGVLFFAAPTIADFFDRTELVALTRVMGIVLIINALTITQNTILTKRIDFKTKTKASLIASISSGVIGIAMAYMGYGVWALVWQQISKQGIYTIFLWIFNKWWPTLKFSIESFHYMWGFGWKLLASTILDTAWSQLYQVVVGKYYSPATLGQYSRSKEYASLFSSNLQSVIGRVSYPVLAEVQDDKERMCNIYRRIIKLTMFVTVVCMISLGAVSEPLIYSLIGSKWDMAANFLPLICVSLSLYPLHAINLNMLKVQGRSDLFLKLEIVKKFVAVGPICLGIFVGIYWMVAGSIVTGIIAFFLNSHYSGKMIGYSSWMQLKDIAPSYILAFTMAVIIFPIKYVIPNCYIALGVQVLVGVVLFFLLVKITKNAEFKELMELAKPAINKTRRR